ncbi:ring finger domain-containing protein [Hirsutella rhossiliensis]|uniref:Ring finger domain-containing protein n=1 Tax=Hirsutella rhossiliensis TaxID=111463 RepID=A0A9P8SGR4_9HYPO|nr:ring finger domain-containing protein [Hirsutella rhossiliensis]KAH0962343.1 ring finger domain-containing protein [Hirsutella rhossiliensis]
MSLTEIRNGVLLFSNPVWEGAKTVPSTLVRNISALSSQIGYEDRISTNLTTLTTTNAPKLDGTFGGLLFVPQVTTVPSCDAQQYNFIPRNVTRREQLPPSNFNVVAIAPWFSMECTLAYLASAARGPVRAFIFYKPNNSTNKPQEVDSPVWNLDDDEEWKKKHHFPIFAVSGLEGQRMMTQLSLYSGTTDRVPHGEEINQLYGPSPDDYVRIWTDLTMQNSSNVPAVWAFVLIVIGALLFVITAVSLVMHFIQRRNRTSLRRRVQSGDVDLEAMGIKRLTVPPSHVESFALFTYNADPDLVDATPAPNSPAANPATHPIRSSRRSRRADQRNGTSDAMPLGSMRSSRSVRSIRSKRSSITGTADTTATNFQPNCHICLASFEHCKTIIRELPCGHIFHPACIDEFLTQNSSLCPMCKHCMLPRGYSPKITNGMVRREQAVRRLRERVDLEDSSINSGDTKFKEWGKRLFSTSGHASPPASSEVHMASRPGAQTSEPKAAAAEADGAASSPDTSEAFQAPTGAKKARPRKSRPRALRLLPTHHEETEPKETATVGRSSPSSFARERMRQIAAKNAPFDDPDHQRPKWRRALSKAFPGFT